MTQPIYPIIPPEREWPGDVEACAQALVRGANGRRGELAALSLLFRDPDQTIFRADVVDTHIDGLSSARVEWRLLHIGARTGAVHGLSPRARAVVMLACSMASSACRVRLGDLLGDLDEPTRTAFVEAAAYLFRGES